MEYVNKVINMFDIDQLRKLIESCPENEVVTICTNWSINKPSYNEQEIADDLPNLDLDDLGAELGNYPIVYTQYDDLVVDVHGIYLA